MNEKIDWANFILIVLTLLTVITMSFIIVDLSKRIDRLDYQKADKPNVRVGLDWSRPEHGCNKWFNSNGTLASKECW